MNRKNISAALLLSMALVLAALSGCGSQKDTSASEDAGWSPIPESTQAAAAEPAQEAEAAPAQETAPAGETAPEAVPAPAPAAEGEAAPAPAPEAAPAPAAGRADGERFEETIMLEGMEETVHYEHVRSEGVGIEMDYDYDLFARTSESGLERFVSVYDNAAAPENYLDVTRSAETAEAAAASITAALSADYSVIQESRTLDNAGTCIYLDASADTSGEKMPEQLQGVYIIPAADGCRIATAHYSIEASEGFGHRFSYMVNTLKVLGGQ